jgi:hypothetical protein
VASLRFSGYPKYICAMRLEAFISELLYEHDCVVLPDFGGLVANYRSARLNRKSHVIAPPSKHVGFNRNLRNNDGLLINHVAGTMNISFSEAQKLVNQVIGSYEQKLAADGRLVLDGIGLFFKDRGDQLQFIPDEQENYLLSSYGLTPVQLKFVEEEVGHTSENETPVIQLAPVKRTHRGLRIAAVLAIPLAIGGLILIGKNLPGNERFNLASLNPFQRYEVIANYSAKVNMPSDAPQMIIQNPLAKWAAGDEGTVKFDFVNCEPSVDGIVVIRNEIVAPPESTRVEPEANPVRQELKTTAARRYAVIGGAFGVPENAENFLQKLRNDGFDAAIAGKKDGLTLVAYGFYASRKEAQQAMNNIRSGGGSAWIRRN